MKKPLFVEKGQTYEKKIFSGGELTMTFQEDELFYIDDKRIYNYKLIENEVNDRVRVMVMEKGQPQTNEQAISIAEEAYKEVKGRHGSRSKNPIKATQGGKLGGTPMPEPKSLEDVIDMVLSGSS